MVSTTPGNQLLQSRNMCKYLRLVSSNNLCRKVSLGMRPPWKNVSYLNRQQTHHRKDRRRLSSRFH